MGGLFTHSGSGMTLTIAESDAHPVGSVCAVSNLSDLADAVVTVETPNLTETVGQYAIMSFTQVQQNVWIPNGGGAGGGSEARVGHLALPLIDPASRTAAALIKFLRQAATVTLARPWRMEPRSSLTGMLKWIRTIWK